MHETSEVPKGVILIVSIMNICILIIITFLLLISLFVIRINGGQTALSASVWGFRVSGSGLTALFN